MLHAELLVGGVQVVPRVVVEDGPEPRYVRRDGGQARVQPGLLGISAALAAVFELVRDVNRRIASRTISTADAGRALGALRDLDRVLGVLPDTREFALGAGLAELLDLRAAARAARDWAASDRLRDELASRGIAVEDSRDGQRWRRVGIAPGA